MGRVESQEWCTVTGREDRRRLRDTVLGSRGLGGVTSQEVVVGLFRGQLGDGRQDTEGITTQHDDVARLSLSDTWDLGVGNVFDGVGASGVFRNRDIVVIGNSVGRVVNNVLEDGSVSDGVEDFGLLFGRQVNGLGVTTTFNVEDTSVGPDVLVITDQQTLGISRQCAVGNSRLVLCHKPVEL